MDDFNPNLNDEEVVENNVSEETPQNEEPQSDTTNLEFEDTPVWNKVEYTPIEEIKDYKPMGKGLKVFCLVMAAVILLAATTAGGYFIGRESVSNNYIGNKVTVGLEQKPTNKEMSTPAQVYQMLDESIVGDRKSVV